MHYCSTRGGVTGVSFTDSLLMGLAPDGGLLVPEQIPDLREELPDLQSLGFVELAKRVMDHFVTDIPQADLHRLIEQAYATFDHADVVGVQQLGQLNVIELFHGPTLAFKDVALQLLGQLFNYVLAQRGEQLNILGATSGDTGSAAIAGVRGQDNVNIFILYPQGRVSTLQELQMTTVPDRNVHCVSVQGSFDDCQTLMKTAFSDLQFKAQHQLGAVNSVNWARVMAQIVYYGYASLRYAGAAGAMDFVVPTGNFGNVFAAYLAKRMGFPIGQLHVATNDNDILARFFNSGEYARGDVHFTLAPAMDIQIASNFERYLYYHFDEDPQRLSAFMQEFSDKGSAELDAPPNDGVFTGTAINGEATLAAIASAYQQYDYVLDPHTAVGYAAYQQANLSETGVPTGLVATAHPAKFPDAVASALSVPVDHERIIHPRLEALRALPERKQTIPATLEAVKGLFGNLR